MREAPTALHVTAAARRRRDRGPDALPPQQQRHAQHDGEGLRLFFGDSSALLKWNSYEHDTCLRHRRTIEVKASNFKPLRILHRSYTGPMTPPKS